MRSIHQIERKEQHCPKCKENLLPWELTCPTCRTTVRIPENDQIHYQEKSEYGAPIYRAN